MAENRDPKRVQGMFDKISGRYDLINHLLSLNLDRSWRKAAVSQLRDLAPARVLDLCGGTGDLTLQLAADLEASEIVCADFSAGMLSHADRKFDRRELTSRCRTVECDALNMPFEDGRFDGLTIGFGVRNLVDRRAGFAEMARVLRPGGLAVILEFSQPNVPVLSQLYEFYLGRVLPKIGDGVSGEEGPYGYLARTIGEFPTPEELSKLISESGFSDCRWIRMTGGIVAIHVASKLN